MDAAGQDDGVAGDVRLTVTRTINITPDSNNTDDNSVHLARFIAAHVASQGGGDGPFTITDVAPAHTVSLDWFVNPYALAAQIAMVYFGAGALDKCAISPMIPVFLLGMWVIL